METRFYSLSRQLMLLYCKSANDLVHEYKHLSFVYGHLDQVNKNHGILIASVFSPLASGSRLHYAKQLLPRFGKVRPSSLVMHGLTKGIGGGSCTCCYLWRWYKDVTLQSPVLVIASSDLSEIPKGLDVPGGVVSKGKTPLMLSWQRIDKSRTT